MDRTNVRASLRIVGECFDVQRVTDTLEVTPSRTWNKGEPIRNSGKNYTCTTWIYATESVESQDINTSIKEIEELFYAKTDMIAALKKQYELYVSIDICIMIENGEPPAIYFEPEFIKFAAEIDATIDVDTYVN